MDQNTKDKVTKGLRDNRTKQQRDEETKERRENGTRGWKQRINGLMNRRTKGNRI